MEGSIYNLGDVARMLGVKPHHITYALSSGGVPEPRLRLGNRRVFTQDDVRCLAEHLEVAVKLGSEPGVGSFNAPVGVKGEVHVQAALAAESPLLNSPFGVVQAGESCHEIRDGLGDVIAWAADRARAFVIAGLLEHACR